MITLPSNITGSDLHQWLNRGTFLFLSPATDELDVGQMSVWPDIPNKNMCEVYSLSEEVSYGLDPPITDKVFPHWPLCGAVNIASYKIAVIAHRLQSQQYRRTFNPNCITIKIPRLWDIRKALGLAPKIPRDSVEVAKECFFPSYPEGAAKLSDRWADGWKSVALSPYVIVINLDGQEHVYYRGSYVGELKNNALANYSGRLHRRSFSHLNKVLEGAWEPTPYDTNT